jgi:hypothetical protein
MFELFSDMYFVVYKLYYFGQNDDLDIRVSLKNWDGGSTLLRGVRHSGVVTFCLIHLRWRFINTLCKAKWI